MLKSDIKKYVTDIVALPATIRRVTIRSNNHDRRAESSIIIYKILVAY